MTSEIPEPLSAWLISDGLPGHYNPSLGILNAIKKFRTVNHTTIEVRLRLKVLRPLMRFLTNTAPIMCPFLLRLFYQFEALPSSRPDLVISSGGNTLFFNAAINSKYRDTKNIFNGTLKHYSPNRFFRVFSVVPLGNYQNNIVLDLPPVNIPDSPGLNNPRTEDQDRATIYCLLVGGDGAGYQYHEKDWIRLAEGINHISQTNNAQWLITTSRRTGTKAEEILERTIDSSITKEAIWYSKNPQRIIQRFLSGASRIFCTEESLTMVSEAIYSGKPVHTLIPDTYSPIENDRLALERYAEQGYIQRIKISDLPSITDLHNGNPPNISALQQKIFDALELVTAARTH